MRNIIDEFSVGKYKVLRLDGNPPQKEFTEYVIDGVSYSIIPLYDAPNCIAIEATASFVGKSVFFQ